MFVPEFGRDRVVGVGDLDACLDRCGEGCGEDDAVGSGSCDACVMISACVSVRFVEVDL